MARYARDTRVTVESSKAEIEMMVSRYGASSYVTGWTADESAWIGFRLRDLFIRFVLPVPKKTEKRFTHRVVRKSTVKATDLQVQNAWDQEIRSRWRSLALVVKAKLEAVECGISTLEKEFLAFIVMPNDITIGDWMTDVGLPSIRAGKVPLALQAKKDDIQDAEVI